MEYVRLIKDGFLILRSSSDRSHFVSSTLKRLVPKDIRTKDIPRGTVGKVIERGDLLIEIEVEEYGRILTNPGIVRELSDLENKMLSMDEYLKVQAD